MLAGQAVTNPWNRPTEREVPRYQPDYDLLGRLLTVPVSAGAVSESGSFANGIDAWIAAELRRAGFLPDEVWPRPVRPRVLPRDIAVLLTKLPAALRAEVALRLGNMPAVAPVDARILGRAYEKQVDVVIARWDRGPEVLVRTCPTGSRSPTETLGNLRSRYPLAAVGYFFVQRATIRTTEPDAFERSVDMIRKLRDQGDTNGYTATALILVDWDNTADHPVVTAQPRPRAPRRATSAVLRRPDQPGPGHHPDRLPRPRPRTPRPP